MELTDHIYNHLGNCQIPFAFSLDLSKVFDTLDHNIFLHKLDHYGIRGVANNYLEVIPPTDNNLFKLII